MTIEADVRTALNDPTSRRTEEGAMMKAWRSHQAGGPESLVLEDVPVPEPTGDEILVKVQGVGINFPDGLFLRDLYQVKPPRPLVPGSEFSGVVAKTGPAATDFAVGDPVIGRCGWGAMAQYLALSQGKCVRLPESLPRVEAAAFTFVYATAYHALHDQAALQPGETLLVLGASGGVGLSAIEIGKVLGAKVIACASTAAKLQVCREHGADETINYVDEDMRARVKAITQGKGVDVIYDPVGGKYSELALRDMAWGGRLLVVGFADGEIPKIPLNLPLIKGCSIVGVWWGQWSKGNWDQHGRNVAQLGAWFREGKIKPRICAAFPLERAADALKVLAERKVTGKVVLTVDS